MRVMQEGCYEIPCANEISEICPVGHAKKRIS